MELETLSTITTNEDINIIEVQGGDVLVLTHSGRIAPARFETIRSEIATLLPGVKVLLLEDDVHFDSVIRRVAG